MPPTGLRETSKQTPRYVDEASGLRLSHILLIYPRPPSRRPQEGPESPPRRFRRVSDGLGGCLPEVARGGKRPSGGPKRA
eukprot:6319535-Pyramimonas_sp.AAC.1